MTSPTIPIPSTGRPRRNVPTVKRKIVLSADLALLIEETLPNRHGRARYGAWSELVETLLRRWLEDQDIGAGFAAGVAATVASPSPIKAPESELPPTKAPEPQPSSQESDWND